MSTSIAAEELASLLTRCGHAHHAAFTETDGADPEWATWYAPWLQAHIGDRIGGKVLTRAELTYRLVRAEREHNASGKKEAWPAFYARSLLAS